MRNLLEVGTLFKMIPQPY